VTRAVALAVAQAAVDAGLAGIAQGRDVTTEVDAAMWWPDYVPYESADQDVSPGSVSPSSIPLEPVRIEPSDGDRDREGGPASQMDTG
jgi:hypothetical protein